MQEPQSKPKRRWRRWTMVAVAIVCVVLGASYVQDLNLGEDDQSPSPSATDAPAETYTLYAEPESIVESEEGTVVTRGTDASHAAPDSSEGQDSKIIQTASMTIKTQAFEADLQQIKASTASLGGRIETASVNGDREKGATRTASLTLRLPAEQLETFLTGTSTLQGRITASSTSSEDVSDTYYDLETRLNTQKTKLARLQELMAQATDVADLIDIESAISDAQYAIDAYTGRLNQYDSQVSFSTVSITLREETMAEAAQEAPSFWTRLVSGLTVSLQNAWTFLQDAAIFLVMAAPWCAVLAIGICLVYVSYKKKK